MLASLFTTSCKELMSNLDEPVSSYLSAPADITVPTGDTYDLSKVVTTINSDETITYESSDPNIATVDKTTGLVTGLIDGEAEITASIKGNDYYLAGEQKIKVAVKRPLTFEALEDGSIRVVLNNYINLPKPIVYTIINKDGKETKTITADGTMSTSLSIAVSKGDKVEFESANDHTAVYEYDANYGYYRYRYVRIYPANCKCAVYGNVMSMINSDGNYHTNKTLTQPYAFYRLLYGSYTSYDKDGDGIYETREYRTLSHDKYKLLLPATKLSDHCYYYMLRGTGLTEIPELPAEELAPYCYYYMFADCWNLTKISSLPAKKLADRCYSGMFSNCDGLTESPALTAEEVGYYSYAYMFQNCDKLKTAGDISATKVGTSACYQMFFNCKNLTKAPALLATTLENSCYSGMFAGCTSLEKAPALPATDLKSYCYNNMFGGCTALTEAPELKAETLAYNCYNNMFNGCSKLNKVVCLAKTNAQDALAYWLNGAGTDASVTKRTLVRAESNKKWTNNDGWTWGTANWYVPTSWTIEPPIPVENIRVKTYTDGAFPYWSYNNCVTSVINGAAHYVPTGSWSQFVCLPGSENPLAAGDYVFILDINSDKDLDANMVELTIRKGWGSDGNPVTAKVPIKAGRHSYRLELPGVIGGNYDCYFTPGPADATLDLYSVSVNKVVE